MRFSVITPTRNALHYLKRCVGSVRTQQGVEVEHLVHDGCSTDGTPQWLAGQSGLHWRSEADAGMYDAINRGFARASGDVLSWLNSDEQYLPGTLQRVASVFDDHPDVDWVFGDYIVVDTHGHPIAARREVPVQRSVLLHCHLPVASCTLFFRRRLRDEGVLQFDSGLRYAADLDLMLQLTEAGRKCHQIKEYLSLFTFDGSNLSCAPGMLEETALVQRRHGAVHSSLSTSLVKARRFAAKFSAGSYARKSLSYDYTTNEFGVSRRVSADGVGGSHRTQ